MLDFLCSQTRYDYGDKAPAPPPTTTSVLDTLGLSWLWQTPTPKYDGLPAAGSSSPGFLCWLFGSPTPAYQTTAPPVPSPPIPRQMPPRDNPTER